MSAHVPPVDLVGGLYSWIPSQASPTVLARLQASPVRLVVVDVETTGLSPDSSQVSEIAWYCLNSSVGGCFIPQHTLDGASPRALEVSRYHERIAGQMQDDGTQLRALHQLLGGDGVDVHLVGSNPAFDAAHLRATFSRAGIGDPRWKHRLIDPAAAAYWMFPAASAPTGLSEACALAGVELEGHHDANVDVRATAALWHALESRRLDV